MKEVISEEERHEAATEEAATVGCPSLGIPKLPGGFDGTEPAGAQGGGAVPYPPPEAPEGSATRGAPHKVSEEARAKVEQSVIRMRQKLTKIADLALTAEAKSNSEHVKLGSKYLENSKAIAEIRRLCKKSLVEEVVPDYEWLAQIMTSDHFEPECLAKAIEAVQSNNPNNPNNRTIPTFYTPGWLCDLAKKIAGDKGAECVPHSPEEQSALQREEARQKRKIHWTCYPTKVDLCVMGKTEQNGKVYEVRVNKRKVADIQDTYGQCKVNGKTVLTVSFTGGAWMLKRILTQGMQALVNYKAKKNRDSRRNYKRRDAAAKQQAHDNKGDAV